MWNFGWITFTRTRADVVNKEGDTILVAERVDDLYLFSSGLTAESKNTSENREIVKTKNNHSLEDWHICMGHLNVQYFLEAVKAKTIKGLKIKGHDKTLECDVCLQEKMHRLPFPKVSERVTKVGKLVHSGV